MKATHPPSCAEAQQSELKGPSNYSRSPPSTAHCTDEHCVVVELVTDLKVILSDGSVTPMLIGPVENPLLHFH